MAEERKVLLEREVWMIIIMFYVGLCSYAKIRLKHESKKTRRCSVFAVCSKDSECLSEGLKQKSKQLKIRRKQSTITLEMDVEHYNSNLLTILIKSKLEGVFFKNRSEFKDTSHLKIRNVDICVYPVHKETENGEKHNIIHRSASTIVKHHVESSSKISEEEDKQKEQNTSISTDLTNSSKEKCCRCATNEHIRKASSKRSKKRIAKKRKWMVQNQIQRENWNMSRQSKKTHYNPLIQMSRVKYERIMIIQPLEETCHLSSIVQRDKFSHSRGMPDYNYRPPRLKHDLNQWSSVCNPLRPKPRYNYINLRQTQRSGYQFHQRPCSNFHLSNQMSNNPFSKSLCKKHHTSRTTTKKTYGSSSKTPREKLNSSRQFPKNIFRQTTRGRYNSSCRTMRTKYYPFSQRFRCNYNSSGQTLGDGDSSKEIRRKCVPFSKISRHAYNPSIPLQDKDASHRQTPREKYINSGQMPPGKSKNLSTDFSDHSTKNTYGIPERATECNDDAHRHTQRDEDNNCFIQMQNDHSKSSIPMLKDDQSYCYRRLSDANNPRNRKSTHRNNNFSQPYRDTPNRNDDEFAASEASMNIEWMRIHSFWNFPYVPEEIRFSTLALAQSGFYFTGSGDEVRCFSCRVIHPDLYSGENPGVVHRHISPQCPHIAGVDRRNSPVDKTTGSANCDAQYPVYSITDNGQNHNRLDIRRCLLSQRDHSSSYDTEDMRIHHNERASVQSPNGPRRNLNEEEGTENYNSNLREVMEGISNIKLQTGRERGETREHVGQFPCNARLGQNVNAQSKNVRPLEDAMKVNVNRDEQVVKQNSKRSTDRKSGMSSYYSKRQNDARKNKDSLEQPVDSQCKNQTNGAVLNGVGTPKWRCKDPKSRSMEASQENGHNPRTEETLAQQEITSEFENVHNRQRTDDTSSTHGNVGGFLRLRSENANSCVIGVNTEYRRRAISRLSQENTILRQRLNCTRCRTKRANRILTQCGHLYCLECTALITQCVADMCFSTDLNNVPIYFQ